MQSRWGCHSEFCHLPRCNECVSFLLCWVFGSHNAEVCSGFVEGHLVHCNEAHGFRASQHVRQHAFGESSQFISHALNSFFPVRSESELSIHEDVACGGIDPGIGRPKHTGDWRTRVQGVVVWFASAGSINKFATCTVATIPCLLRERVL